MPVPKTKIDYEQQLQINDLAKDIELIKDNHLVHLEMSVLDLKTEVKDNREHFDKKLDRLDNRIYWVLGLTVTTLASILASMVI
jgi:hypothetical protein